MFRQITRVIGKIYCAKHGHKFTPVIGKYQADLVFGRVFKPVRCERCGKQELIATSQDVFIKYTEPEYCEHKSRGAHHTMTGDRYGTQCGKMFIEHMSSLRSEFCPYCGKRIKEVK